MHMQNRTRNLGQARHFLFQLFQLSDNNPFLVLPAPNMASSAYSEQSNK